MTSAGPRFIPLSRRDLIELCATDEQLDDGEGFHRLCDLLTATIHAEHHDRLEALKEAYAPFDPNVDTRPVRRFTDEELAASKHRFAAELRAVLDAANFEEVTDDDLGVALDAESLLEVRLHVEFDDFEEVAFYRRGAHVRRETVTKLFGLVKREIEFINYDRVVMHVQLRDRAHFEAKGRTDLAFEPGSTMLKLFRDVPRPDLEMLFPNTEVRMRPVDKVMIGVPAVIGGVVVIATKLLASLGVVLVLLGVWLGLSDADVELDQAELIALGAGLGSVGGYLLRQLAKFKTRKIRFMKTLADNLYFKNLDNDAGVFHHLIDAAEEEDTKEAVLAYWWLLRSGPCTAAVIDRELEAWLARACDQHVDFEIADAVAKLATFGLVERDGEILRALPIAEAWNRLDARWDDRFDRRPVAADGRRTSRRVARRSTGPTSTGRLRRLRRR